jgi:hypothetical protein
MIQMRILRGSGWIARSTKVSHSAGHPTLIRGRPIGWPSDGSRIIIGRLSDSSRIALG